MVMCTHTHSVQTCNHDHASSKNMILWELCKKVAEGLNFPCFFAYCLKHWKSKVTQFFGICKRLMVFAPIWWFLRPFDRFLRPFCARVWHIFCVNSKKNVILLLLHETNRFSVKRYKSPKSVQWAFVPKILGTNEGPGGYRYLGKPPYRCVFVTISNWWYYHLDTQYPLILDWLPTHFVNSFHVDLMVDINPSDL